MGSWSNIDLTITLRFESPNEIIVNYNTQEGAHNALILLDNHIILERISDEQPSQLGESPVEYLSVESWNKINIKVENGNTYDYLSMILRSSPSPMINRSPVEVSYSTSSARPAQRSTRSV